MANPDWTDPQDWSGPKPVPEYVEKLHTLPEHMQYGVRAWIEHGHNSHPGGFLSAFLRNDLMDALGRADEENRAALHRYAVYFYCYAPSGCFGSKENFEDWRGLLSAQVQPC